MLLILAVLILSASLGVGVYYALKSVFSDREPVYFGPAPTSEETRRHRDWLHEFISKHPESGLSKANHEIRESLQKSLSYDMLRETYENGIISKKEYERRLSLLIKKVSLKDLLK